MNIVVDTNIIFSGILSPNGTICDLLLNSQNTFEFYAPAAILDELERHHKKLLKLSGLSEDELDLIDLEALQQKTWEKAIELTKNVDAFDTPFVALSLELDSPLWTGDKKLAMGLEQKGIDWILNTETIKQIRNDS